MPSYVAATHRGIGWMMILLRLADQPWLVAVLGKCAARGLAGEYCAAGAPLCDHGRAHGLAYTLWLCLIGVTEETHSAWNMRFYCCHPSCFWSSRTL
eukprot:57186-Eustigmatos_ZCMA.PRE.1